MLKRILMNVTIFFFFLTNWRERERQSINFFFWKLFNFFLPSFSSSPSLFLSPPFSWKKNWEKGKKGVGKKSNFFLSPKSEERLTTQTDASSPFFAVLTPWIIYQFSIIKWKAEEEKKIFSFKIILRKEEEEEATPAQEKKREDLIHPGQKKIRYWHKFLWKRLFPINIDKNIQWIVFFFFFFFWGMDFFFSSCDFGRCLRAWNI